MKNKYVIFPLTLLIIPLIVTILYKIVPYDTVRFIWYYLILYTCYFGGIYSLYNLKRYYKKDKFTTYQKIILILILLFFISCIISSIFGTSFTQSLLGTDYRREGLFTYIAYFLITINCMFLKNDDKKKYFNLLIIVGCILSIFSLFKIKGFISPYQISYNGIFYQFNHFSYFLILSLVSNTCLFINENNKKLKIMYYISYLILLIQLILNNTFGSYIAIMITTIFIIIYYLKIKKYKLSTFIILVTFTLCSIFINSNNQSIVLKNFTDNTKEVINTDFNDEKQVSKLGTTRGKLWIEAIKMIKKRPLIGYGIENLEMEYHNIGMTYADKPHNIVLALSGYVGIPGMLFFITTILLILYEVLKQITKLNIYDVIAYFSVICFLGSSIVANSMYYTTPYAFICIGIILGILFKNHFSTLTNE